jgi:hypothetical protein
LPGIAHGQRSQEQFIEHRKDRGIRANAERQRQHRDRRDERRLEQHAGGERDVSHRGDRKRGRTCCEDNTFDTANSRTVCAVAWPYVAPTETVSDGDVGPFKIGRRL